MKADASDDRSLIGRVIQERFRILDRIASGGMGAVYLAEQLPLGRKVALKVLQPAGDNYSAKAQFQERFFLEAAAVAKLSHPNTIVLFDYGRTEDGRFFYAMEFVEGVTLNKLVRDRGYLDSALAVHIAAQICGSLREAHEAGLVHRDLKPGNVMLTRRGDDPHFVKVLDFGLVKFVGADAGSELTRSGIMMGSPRYMAPEQVETRNVDHRADIYAFGTVLFHMLAGQPPFVYPGQFETLRAQVEEPPPPIEKINPKCDLGPELHTLLNQCLEKRPEARPQSMAEVGARLKACAAELGISIPSLSGVDISLLASARAPAAPPPAEDRAAPGPTIAAKRSVRPAERAPEPPTAAGAPSTTAPAPARASRAWMVLAGVAVVATGLAGGVAAFILPADEPDAEQVVAALPPEPPPPSAPAADPVEPAPAPAPIAPVTIESDPPRARVRRGDADLGDTPVALPIPAGEQWQVTLALDGYETRTVTVLAGQPRVHVRLAPTAPAEPEPAGSRSSRPRAGRRPAHRPAAAAPAEPAPRPTWGASRSSDNRDPWAN
ncbi:MAG TPA: serine/threonine-protein kinase [Sandaracinaceae bacterium]